MVSDFESKHDDLEFQFESIVSNEYAKAGELKCPGINSNTYVNIGILKVIEKDGVKQLFP
jgi:hypothetical protein